MPLAIKSFIVSGTFFLLLDALWLSVTAGMYKRVIGEHLAQPFPIGPAALFYVLYVCGIAGFSVLPALSNGDWVTALWKGAFLGLVAYGTYDLTNLATLEFWSWRLALIDMAWGTVLTGTTAALAVKVLSYFADTPN